MTPIVLQLDPVSMVVGGLLCFSLQAGVLLGAALVVVIRRRSYDQPGPRVVK